MLVIVYGFKIVRLADKTERVVMVERHVRRVVYIVPVRKLLNRLPAFGHDDQQAAGI